MSEIIQVALPELLDSGLCRLDRQNDANRSDRRFTKRSSEGHEQRFDSWYLSCSLYGYRGTNIEADRVGLTPYRNKQRMIKQVTDKGAQQLLPERNTFYRPDPPTGFTRTAPSQTSRWVAICLCR